MCGIAGIYAHEGSAGDPEELTRVCDAMSARGPDDAGAWEAKGAFGKIQLGHRRLSIIDLHARSKQPMELGDRFVITYNGEIYNHEELRTELEALGHVFRTTSDTEVILQLFERHGPEAVQRLQGMFAFAIWDRRLQSLFLARDPYGIKPLYYAEHEGVFRFASQVSALVAGGGVDDTIDNAAVAGFYLLGSVPEPLTIRRAIRAFPPGSYAWVRQRGMADPTPYFGLASTLVGAQGETCASLSALDLQRDVTKAVHESVNRHLVSDVPVGAFLSAGIDSTALVSIMREKAKTEIQTVTLAYDEYRGGAWDESHLAAEFAGQRNVEHQTVTVSEADFSTNIDRILRAMDQPSVDGINTWFVSRAAASLGLKVVVSGLGGDELFAGYHSTFRQIPQWVRWLKYPASVPFAGDIWRRGWSALPSLIRNRFSPKMAGAVKFGGDFASAYLLRRGVYMPWELGAVMGEEAAFDGLDRLTLVDRIASTLRPEPKSDYARIATLEASWYMRNQLLRDSDWASMDHSLELRVPLVDSQLFATIAPKLAAHRHPWSKQLLANAPSTPLPRSITHRDKTGFAIPVQQWMERSKNPALGRWRQVADLRNDSCPWAKRFAYVVMQNLQERGAPA